jgi:hypothetical protein
MAAVTLRAKGGTSRGEYEDRGGGEADYKLREDLIRELESRVAASPVKFSDIYQSKIIPNIEADKLHASGFPVLDDFPTDSDGIKQFRRAIKEHGKCYIKGRNLAFTVANSQDLRVSNPVLYDHFFPYLCVDDELYNPSFEQFESVLSGDDDSSGSDRDHKATDTCYCDTRTKPAKEVPIILEHAASDSLCSRLRRRMHQKDKAPGQQSAKKAKQQEALERPTNAEGDSAGSASKKATLTGILFCVHAFLASIPVVHNNLQKDSDKFQMIFQKFESTGKRQTLCGDGSRSQIKAQGLPMPQRQAEDTDKSFYSRWAGYAFLLLYLEKSFDLFASIITPDYDFSRHWNRLFSSALRSLAPSEAQETHTDHDPETGPPGMGAVCNISPWSYWFADLENSAPNITRLNELVYNVTERDRFVKAFSRTKSLQDPEKYLVHVMKGGNFEAKWRRAWQCHCEILVREEMDRDGNASGYKEMLLVNAELEPFMWKAFDAWHVHGGGAYPGKAPRRHRQRKKFKRWLYRYGKVHFRYNQRQHTILRLTCLIVLLTF